MENDNSYWSGIPLIVRILVFFLGLLIIQLTTFQFIGWIILVVSGWSILIDGLVSFIDHLNDKHDNQKCIHCGKANKDCQCTRSESYTKRTYHYDSNGRYTGYSEE